MLYRLLSDEPKEDVAAALNALMADYASRPGLQMVEVAGGYQIVTRPELHEWVRRLFHERSTQKLTVQGLETLAVIAYKQPITALEITEIRGVNTSGVLTTLLERHLIKIVGRKNVVGRPFLYATTKEFLIRFGLKDLGDLPRIEDMAEALGFDPPAGLDRADAARRDSAARGGRGDEGRQSESRDTRAGRVRGPLLAARSASSRQPPDLFARQLAPGARFQLPIRDRSDAGALQRLHRMADRLEHAAHLTIAPFANRHADDAILVSDGRALSTRHVGRQRPTAVERNAGAQAFDGACVGHARRRALRRCARRRDAGASASPRGRRRW